MRIATIAVRNIGRNKLRTLLTVSAVAVAVLAFIMLRTVIWSWNAAKEQAATDRVGTRHKVSIIIPPMLCPTSVTRGTFAFSITTRRSSASRSTL